MNELSELQKAARIAFASEFSFYLKAHEFHWNVEGVHFQQFHDLFGKIYEEVYGIIDDFAEKIRALDSYAPGSLSKLSILSRIDDQETVIPDGAMVQMLLEDSDKMCILLKMVYDVAEREGEHGFSNFLAERMDAHRKHSWMLRSVLK
jgi:starvation-inducible DNA-binding protein